jgi:hypothetical protein
MRFRDGMKREQSVGVATLVSRQEDQELRNKDQGKITTLEDITPEPNLS